MRKKAVKRTVSSPETCGESSGFEPATRKALRRSYNSANFQVTCFFCDSDEDTLHKIMDLVVSNCVRDIACETEDTKILAKLSEGDMIAIEALYHCKCLVAYYNKSRTQKDVTDEPDFRSVALGELIFYILDEENENPGMVFKLSDLTKLYIQTLECLGDHIDYKINSTHLKNRLLQSLNDLHAYKQGRDVFITFKVDVGKSLQKKYLEKSDDDWMHMARAAVILRKSILSHETEFTGEFNSNCQRSSVPQT